MLRAVITAGGRVDGPFAAAIGTPTKALAPFGAGVLLDVVLAAVRDAGIAEVAVVGGDDVAAHLEGSGARILPADPEGATNVGRALDAWSDGDLLYATSDLPFVDAAALGAFLAAGAGYDLTLPLADGDAYERAFPAAPPHVMDLAGTRIANGSVFFIAAGARVAIRDAAMRAFDARKNAFALAALLGPVLLARYALRRLRIGDVERRVQRVLGVRAHAVTGAAPGLCFDVDTLDDYRYACARRR
jgi:CTP:molybdopterin cytidylyltransferase MocA